MNKEEAHKIIRDAKLACEKNTKTITVCGMFQEIMYDKKVSKLDISLERVTNKEFPDEIPYYKISLFDASNMNKSKKLVTLHISEAIELKSFIDNLVYHATTDLVEEAINKQK